MYVDPECSTVKKHFKEVVRKMRRKSDDALEAGTDDLMMTLATWRNDHGHQCKRCAKYHNDQPEISPFGT